MKAPEIEQLAARALAEVFGDVGFAEIVELRRPHGRTDATVDWVVFSRQAGEEIWLLAVVKSLGEPRLAREAVNQLLRDQTHRPGSYGIFIAPWISPKAAEICREAGVGYLDLAGNCYLSFDNIYIQKQGKPNPFAEKRGLRSLYSPRATRVLRVLLQEPPRQWKLQALAGEARVSLGQVHKVKSLLQDREWLHTGPDGVNLSEPRALLAEWAQNYTYRSNQIHEFYSLKPIGDVERELAAACDEQGLRYALAGLSAAARLAPFVRYQRASAFVEGESVSALAQALELREVSSGANVSLWVPYDEGVWYGVVESKGASVTSPIQTYLDLHSMHARAEEASEYLLKEVIEPQW